MLYYSACIRYIEKDKENYNDFIRINEDNFSLYDLLDDNKESSIDIYLNQDKDNYIKLALSYINELIKSSNNFDDSICVEVIISVTDNNSHNRVISYYKACEANNGDLSETDMTNLYNFITSKLYFYNYNDDVIWKETSIFGGEFCSSILVDIVPGDVKSIHYKPKPGDIVTMKDYECHTLKSFQGLIVKCEDDKEFKKYGYKFDDIDIIALNHPHGDNYMNDTFIAGEIISTNGNRPDLLKLANEFKIQELKEKFIKGE